MITAINEMKPGECFSVASDEGGIKKAPCLRKILAVGNTAVASTEFNDRGYTYKLKMDNYLGSEPMKDGNTLHKFSK
ncbi:hypothetical protein OBP_079 [Pseudomonas phage OBP]|uniref:hypothetical protein n=1 Tax=Pseudomonas phage OBP TaxID=1124849 RepID=UPI000240D42D|nr:hypothetical protein OBP_079 [Pseudomonas phage OBP]AEV89516.1 hypothetical protein OBP_079 [Pseudomonas phage OBP]